jgi:hypothetical protein
MKPEKRENMKFPLRKGSVAFLTDKDSLSEQGLLELLEWSEQHQGGYGPRFELAYENNSVEHFKTVKEMRDHFGHQSNEAVAKRLFADIKAERYRLRYIPPFDNLNPLVDAVNLTLEEVIMLEHIGPRLAHFQVFDVVQPTFQRLITEFNRINNPSLVDIASFIRSMILLHPFPDGNGRTFTLGILNQVLLKNKLGICLNLDPRIALLSNAEIAQAIEANLISLEPFVLEETKQQETAEQKIDSPLYANPEEIISTYIQQLNELPVTFLPNQTKTIELIQERRTELLLGLNEIIARNTNEALSTALQILGIDGPHPKISAAISKKTDEINSLTRQLKENVRSEQRKQLDEEHRLEKQLLAEPDIQEKQNPDTKSDTPSSSITNISMMVLGGFITVAGIAAVAIAFTVLNAVTFGIPGLIVAGLGVAAALSGMGLFAAGAYKNRMGTPDELTPAPCELAFQ